MIEFWARDPPTEMVNLQHPSTTSEVSAGLKTPRPKPGAAEFYSKSAKSSRFYHILSCFLSCSSDFFKMDIGLACLLWDEVGCLDAFFLAGLYLKTLY